MGCWRNRERAFEEYDSLKYEVAQQSQVILSLRNRLARLESEAERPARLDIANDAIKDLLMLCHPDRHNNSERANRITRWLISVRKEKVCR